MVIFYTTTSDGTYYMQRAFINVQTSHDVSWWIVPGTEPNGI